MKPFISKVIADGRITLPKELREEERIKEGDFVEVQVIRKIEPIPNPTGAVNVTASTQEAKA